jgi:pilus assembly protein CpaB
MKSIPWTRILPSGRHLMVMLAVAAGLLAAWTARQYIQGRVSEIEAQAQVATVARVVAAFDLPAGTRLQPDYVAVREMPGEWVPSNSLAPDEFAAHENAVLAFDVKRGDLIVPMLLAERREPALSERLKDGRRAITLPVDDVSSQSGMLQPGDLIDLYVSFEHLGKHVTAPLLQGISILAVGHQADPSRGDGRGYATVTLDASPEEAVKLVAARETGRITAVLRHQEDREATRTAARGDLASLLGMDRDQVAVPKAQNVPVLYGDSGAQDDLAVLPDMPPDLAGRIGAVPRAARNGLFTLPDLATLSHVWPTPRRP